MNEEPLTAAVYRLVVLGGHHDGVESCLHEGENRLGSALSNDIVLHEPALGERQIVLTVSPGVVAIECEADGLCRDTDRLEAGRQHRIAAGEIYKVGTLRFTVLPMQGIASTDSMPGKSSEIEPLQSQVPVVDDDLGEPGVPTQPELLSTWLSVRLVVGGMVLFAIVLGASWAGHNAFDRPAGEQVEISMPPPASLSRRLVKAGFSDLDVRRGVDDRPVIEGYVQSRARLLELERFSSVIEPPPQLEVFVQSEIVERVGDVYRTHGIDAIVEPTGAGVVNVLTAERREPDFSALRKVAMQDVQGLQGVEARNEVPAGPTVTKESREAVDASAQMPPGKRVVAVVAGDPSYVVTEDNSRYFVGSSLPSGHTIATIDDRFVTLARAGKKTRLEF